MKLKDPVPGRHHFLGALFSFAALSVAMTWPLALEWQSVVPYESDLPGVNDMLFKGRGDVWHHLWNLWWVKFSLFEHGANPYFTDHFFYPVGTSLILHGFNFASAVWSAPLESVFGLIGQYNIVFFLSFVLSGFFMYTLAFRLTKHVGASLVAGVAYTLSPYHYMHMHHLEHLSIQWIPLFLLFYLEVLQNRKVGYGFAASLSFLLIFYTDLYAAVQVTMLGTILFLFVGRPLWRSLSNKGLWTFITLTLLLALPLALPIALESFQHDYMKSPNWIHDYNSSDLVAFFTPSYYHGIWGDVVTPLYGRFTGFEKIVYLGIPLLILAVPGWRAIPDRRMAAGLAVSFAFFFVIALGTGLHVMGYVLEAVPLPYAFLKEIPLLGSGRTPMRYALMLHTILPIFAAFAVARLSGSKKRGVLVSLIALIIVTIDFYPRLPMGMFEVDHDPFYDMLAADPEEYSICEVPITEWPEPIQYFQTIHKRPILAGMVTYINPASYRFIEATPLVREMYNWNVIDESHGAEYYRKGLERLEENNVRYIVFHPKYFSDESRRARLRILDEILKLPKAWESDELTAYYVSAPE